MYILCVDVYCDNIVRYSSSQFMVLMSPWILFDWEGAFIPFLVIMIWRINMYTVLRNIGRCEYHISNTSTIRRRVFVNYIYISHGWSSSLQTLQILQYRYYIYIACDVSVIEGFYHQLLLPCCVMFVSVYTMSIYYRLLIYRGLI